MQIDPRFVWTDIQAIRKSRPLVHNITNYVVMESSANALLALGASPAPAHALEEVEEMAGKANSLVLNIGTLSSTWIQGMLLALQTANSKGIPVILDLVGAGATAYRLETSRSILRQGSVAAIRGNASEIASFFGEQVPSKGVDSALVAIDYQQQAGQLALKNNCVVWMSGPVDVITDGKSLFAPARGHPIMGQVTGMGCMASALERAFKRTLKRFLPWGVMGLPF
jgi:hydroxyethylthiazole kinase